MIASFAAELCIKPPTRSLNLSLIERCKVADHSASSPLTVPLAIVL